MNDTLTPSSTLTARIEQLLIYPVKSCAGVAVPEALLTDTGLDLDRAWMVVDAEGEFVTQREMPRLALVQPQLKTDHLVLRAPGMLALHIAIDRVEQPLTVRVWDDLVPAYDLGALAGQWITDFLAQPHAGDARPSVGPCRLVRFDPSHRRLSSLKWTGGLEAPNQFSDGYPLLVLSQASLEGLNQQLLEAGQAPVAMARFRPNIVLSGLQAHDEDRLTWLSLASGQPESLNDLTAGAGLVHGVEMNARHAGRVQLVAQVGDDVQTKSLDGRSVVTKALQSQADPARNLGAAGV